MERRRLAPHLYALTSPLLERRGVVALFTERTGGVSEAPFDTLNLGLATGDRTSRVRRNRAVLSRAVGLPTFATARQVHGARAIRVGRRRAATGELAADADVLVTALPRTALGVLTADCVPIALATPDRMAVVHAGWRGLAAGVLASAL